MIDPPFDELIPLRFLFGPMMTWIGRMVGVSAALES